MWLSAIGTCGAVTYALFGAIMRRWFNNPKLQLEISEKFPFCLLKSHENPTVSNADYEVVEVCASIINLKKWCAKNCRVMCKAVYVPDAGGSTFCLYREMRPCQFQWVDFPDASSSRVIDIAQLVSHYVKVAEISNPQNEMSANEVLPSSFSEAPASISVSVYDTISRKPYVWIPFEHKSALIAVCVSCSGNPPINHFIRIDWKGSKVREFDAAGKLKVSLLSEKDGLSLITQ